MDVMKKVEDLTNMALDERTSEKERFNSALGALRLIREYKLLGKKHVDVAANIIEKITNPLFGEEVASRAEKIADNVGRFIGSVKKVSDSLSRGGGDGEDKGGGRSRRYGGRR
jgi:hypothetical protein